MDLFSEIYKAPNFKLAVAMGQVPGWQSFRKFGMNDDLDTGTEEMWPPGTVKVWPTAAAVASVTAGANDVMTTGTGAWKVRIEGLDEDYLEVWEEVELAGATPVLTTQTFLRINRAYITKAGTGETNDAAISITVGGDLQAYIEVGEGQTHQTHYTVPANKVLVVDFFSLSSGRVGNADMAILSQIKVFGTDAWRTISDVQVYEYAYINDSSITILPAKTDVRQRIVCTTTNAEASGIFGGYLVTTAQTVTTEYTA